jgi:hypothetical protein
MKRGKMKSIKITKYIIGEEDPESAVKIPLKIFKVAAKIIPKKVLATLQENDIDIEQIQKLAEDPDIEGTILEAESYKKGVRAVISIE